MEYHIPYFDCYGRSCLFLEMQITLQGIIIFMCLHIMYVPTLYVGMLVTSIHTS